MSVAQRQQREVAPLAKGNCPGQVPPLLGGSLIGAATISDGVRCHREILGMGGFLVTAGGARPAFYVFDKFSD